MPLSNAIPTSTGPTSHDQPAPDAESTSVPAGQRLCGAPPRNRPGDPTLTMEPPGTAVRTAVSPGRARPSGPKLSVLFRRSYVLSFNHVLVDMVVSGLSQNPHLEITNLALSWTQSWCAVRANPHLQPARMRGQSFHVGVRPCNHAPSLMSGPAICQSFIIS